jgi:hypothetical protein
MNDLRSFALVVLLIFVFPLSLFAQAREISRDEFYKPLREQYTKTRGLSMRTVREFRSSRDGEAYVEKLITEDQPPDRVRYIRIELIDGKEKKTEQINIGKTIYCKKGNVEWSMTKSYCIGGSGSGGPSNVIKEITTAEKVKVKGKPMLLYRSYLTFTDKYSKTAESDGPSFWETRIWVNNEGLIERNETRRGLASSGVASYEIIETYEFGPNIKIESPIPDL